MISYILSTPVLLLLIGGVVMTIGDVFMKYWVEYDLSSYFLIGYLIYMVGIAFLARSYKGENIAEASLTFVIFNVVTLLLLSWFVFKEAASARQIIGIVLGLTAVYLLEIG